MIRIHTGGCPVCGSPIFVDFRIERHTHGREHVFQCDTYYGEVKEVIYSCECVVKAEPETGDHPANDPHYPNLQVQE